MRDAFLIQYSSLGFVLSAAIASGAVTSAASRMTVDLSVDISGANIGYIYLFVGYFDANANSLNVTDTDFLESPNTREVSGVYDPVWDENGFLFYYATRDPIILRTSFCLFGF